MIWYLIFCSQFNGKLTCLPPQRVENQQACQSLGRNMKDNATSVFRGVVARVRCVRVRE